VSITSEDLWAFLLFRENISKCLMKPSDVRCVVLGSALASLLNCGQLAKPSHTEPAEGVVNCW